MFISFGSNSKNDWIYAYQRAKAGSDKDLVDLVKLAAPEIRGAARSYSANMVDYEDNTEKAKAYIVETVKTKPEDIINPENYFTKGIHLEIKHEKIERDKYFRRTEFIDAFKKSDIENNGCKSEFPAKDAYRPDSICYLNEVFEIISKFPENIQKILLAPVLEGKTSEELSKELNIPITQLEKIRSRMRKKLKKLCEYES